MSSTVIGYARCSTERDDMLAQRKALRRLGVENKRIYVDRGLAGDPPRPALQKALAAAQRGDTIIVTKLGRLARSMRDASAIGERLAAAGVKLSLGGVLYDPKDPAARGLFDLLGTFAEFEVDVLQLRTRQGMVVARANGRLKGRKPKLTSGQQAELLELYASRQHHVSELAQRFSVSRATVYRALDRAGVQAQ
jgi:DNA invertase Pin-like site-specific DNA recombinase